MLSCQKAELCCEELSNDARNQHVFESRSDGVVGLLNLLIMGGMIDRS